MKIRKESDSIWSDTNMEMEVEIPTSEKLDEIDLEHYLETQGA